MADERTPGRQSGEAQGGIARLSKSSNSRNAVLPAAGENTKAMNPNRSRDRAGVRTTGKKKGNVRKD